MNYLNRFQTDNYQFEVDLYPRIIEGLYAYVSGGISNNLYNPTHDMVLNFSNLYQKVSRLRLALEG
jgi:YaiO family outer membrane protein